MTTRFEEWEAERLRDPEFLAALAARYPEHERDRAQVQITILQEENASLRAACGAIVQEIDDNQVYYGSLQGHREQLAAAIGGAVEWVEDSEPDFGKYCPWCGNFEKSGHAHNCQRQAALKVE